MSRKHNVRHDSRGKSNYPERLAKRGESNVTVRMIPLDQLRKAALRRGDALDQDEVFDDAG